jgi:hypothetical protein
LFTDTDKSTIKELALDLVGAHDIDGFNALIPKMEKLEAYDRMGLYKSALRIAAAASSIALVEATFRQITLLQRHSINDIILMAAKETIKSEDTAISRTLIQFLPSRRSIQVRYQSSENFFPTLMTSHSYEMVEL